MLYKNLNFKTSLFYCYWFMYSVSETHLYPLCKSECGLKIYCFYYKTFEFVFGRLNALWEKRKNKAVRGSGDLRASNRLYTWVGTGVAFDGSNIKIVINSNPPRYRRILVPYKRPMETLSLHFVYVMVVTLNTTKHYKCIVLQFPWSTYNNSLFKANRWFFSGYKYTFSSNRTCNSLVLQKL